MTEDTKTVVTERTDMVTARQTNSVQVVLMPPWKIVLIRAARVYFMTLTGLCGAAGIGIPADVGVTMHTAVTLVQALGACAVIALVPAAVSAAWNALELFNQWDASHPEIRA